MGVRFTPEELATRTTRTASGAVIVSPKKIWQPPAQQPVSGNLYGGVKPEFYIGIDPGLKTGFAIWQTARPANLNGQPRQPAQYVEVSTYTHVQAVKRLMELARQFGTAKLRVRIEDVRGKAQVFRQRQGDDPAIEGRKASNIGSNKRDCQLLIDWLEEIGIPYDAIVPKPQKGKKAAGDKSGKVQAEYFKGILGFPGKSSQHARDAARLILGL